MSERLRKLEKRGYIRDSPPADRSGMYELTELGAIAAFHIQKYVRDYHNTFHAATEIALDNQPNDAFYPDLVTLDDAGRIVLFELAEAEGLTVPSELHDELMHNEGYSPQTADEELYTLFYHGLAERVDGMNVYRLTERGEKAVNLPREVLTEPIEFTERLRETYPDNEKKRLNTLVDEIAKREGG
jgi:DNA-binding PadR family transcriptional regulator